MRMTVPGKLPSMNQFISANRTNVHVGNKMKQDSQQYIALYVPNWPQFERKVHLRYKFYEPNQKRDLDNVESFFKKVFQDALVAKGVLKNDGWANITGSSTEFYIDKDNPRIEIDVNEVD